MTTRRSLPLRCLAIAAVAAGLACGGEFELHESVDGVKADDPGELESGVVYGTDNRQDVYAHPDATLRARAQQSTVALMDRSDVNTSNPNNVTFRSSTLGVAQNLCSTERFRNDPTAAFCSGTLIDDDLVLTAGHCITSTTDCANTRFVFNYYRTGANTMQTVTTADVFSCSQIVARREGTVGGQVLDYAIVRLDRPATPRFTPAPVRTANVAMSTGQNVAVIGSGSGIPFKIDSGGKVRNARAGVLDYFIATTDTFGGNSGSGVYETNSHEVVGILVRGDTDYVRSGSCYRVNVCTESGCGGEGVNYVAPALQHFCASNTSARLCGSTPPPTGGQTTTTLTGSVAANAEQHHPAFQVTPGTTFQVTMSGSGDPDLYVRFGSQPTTSAYNCRPYLAGANETCSLTVPANATTAWLMVRGYSAATYSLQVTWTPSGGSQPAPTAKTATVSGSVAQGGSNPYEPITVTPGTQLRVVMTGTGDPDLYVRFGSAPTTSAYDCRPYLAGASETCTLTVPSGASQAYIAVRGYTAASYSLTLNWTGP